MLTFLINLNSTHNDCNIREAFTVLRECTLPECLEYDISSFFFAFLSFSFYFIVHTHSTGLFVICVHKLFRSS